ncbi:MAG: hypothetical protein WBE45_10665 [Terriglobales bacterium]
MAGGAGTVGGGTVLDVSRPVVVGDDAVGVMVGRLVVVVARRVLGPPGRVVPGPLGRVVATVPVVTCVVATRPVVVVVPRPAVVVNGDGLPVVAPGPVVLAWVGPVDEVFPERRGVE